MTDNSEYINAVAHNKSHKGTDKSLNLSILNKTCNCQIVLRVRDINMSNQGEQSKYRSIVVSVFSKKTNSN